MAMPAGVIASGMNRIKTHLVCKKLEQRHEIDQMCDSTAKSVIPLTLLNFYIMKRTSRTITEIHTRPENRSLMYASFADSSRADERKRTQAWRSCMMGPSSQTQ